MFSEIFTPIRDTKSWCNEYAVNIDNYRPKEVVASSSHDPPIIYACVGDTD